MDRGGVKQTPIKRRKPVNSMNRVRLASLRDKQYGLSFGYAAWICSHPCSVPDCKRGSGWTVPAHTKKTKGAGGTWRDLTPLCFIHESEFHSSGRFSFDRKYGIKCSAIADEMVRRWEGERDPEGVTGTGWGEDSGG